MSDQHNRFLEAERIASQLVERLNLLMKEAKSYEGATGELDSARKGVMKLCEDLARIASETEKAILIIKDIGGPAILEGINNLDNEFKKHSTALTERLAAAEIKADIECAKSNRTMKLAKWAVALSGAAAVLAALGLIV